MKNDIECVAAGNLTSEEFLRRKTRWFSYEAGEVRLVFEVLHYVVRLNGFLMMSDVNLMFEILHYVESHQFS